MILKYCILEPNIYTVKFLILTPVLQLDNTHDLNLHINILNNTPVTAWRTTYEAHDLLVVFRNQNTIYPIISLSWKYKAVFFNSNLPNQTEPQTRSQEATNEISTCTQALETTKPKT